MKISECSSGQGNINLDVTVEEIQEPRVINKMGRDLRVANVVVKDDSGSIVLTLWNENIDRVQQGMTLKLENAYCNEYQGKPQLTLGKFGKLVTA